jgi:hypothetical protein
MGGRCLSKQRVFAKNPRFWNHVAEWLTIYVFGASIRMLDWLRWKEKAEEREILRLFA